MVQARSNIKFSDYVSYVFTSLVKRRIVIVFFLVCIAAILFLGIQLVVRIVNNEVTFLKVLPLIVVAALIIFYFSLFFGMCMAQYRRTKQAFNEESDYIFLNNKFVIARADTDTGYDVFYNTIHEIIEKKKRIFFFIGPQKSFMMRKNNFLTGDITKLREILKKNCPNAKLKLKK